MACPHNPHWIMSGHSSRTQSVRSIRTGVSAIPIDTPGGYDSDIRDSTCGVGLTCSRLALIQVFKFSDDLGRYTDWYD
jgi:hypothetical protein